jgi:hypothetical protein
MTNQTQITILDEKLASIYLLDLGVKFFGYIGEDNRTSGVAT